MAVKIPKVTKTSVIDVVRDGAGLVVTTGLSESLSVLGAGLGIWIGPMIAKTPGGKQFNRMWAILMLADKSLELVTGGKGVVA